MGCLFRRDKKMVDHLYHGQASYNPGIRRRLDLWIEGQHRLTGICDQPRLPGPPYRSAARAAGFQKASVHSGAAQGWKDDPLWGQDVSVWRMVFHAAACRQWLDDRRRFSKFPEL